LRACTRRRLTTGANRSNPSSTLRVAAVERRVLRGVGDDLPCVLLLEAFQGRAAQVLPAQARPRKVCEEREGSPLETV